MARPRVFLGSSGKSYSLVTWFAQRLSQHNVATPLEWKVDGFPPGVSTLDSLIRHGRQIDFAVIFLTEDDALLKTTGPTYSSVATGTSKLYAPRDNCIFEAGLFVGALGLDPRRCFLVSSVDQKALPTDLLGLTVISMPKPALAQEIDDAWCNDNLQPVFANIKQQIRELGWFLLRPVLTVFTKDQLAELEQVGEGKLVKGESVVVNSVEPVERHSLRFATAVINNIFERTRYHYFFKGSERGAFRWVELLRTLVLASIARANEDVLRDPPQYEDQIAKVLNDNRDNAIKAIEQLQVYLRIHLLHQTQQVPLRICVHNAQSEEAAKCYFRFARDTDVYFVHWCSGSSAQAVVEELLALSSQPPGALIFCPTRLFDLHSKRKNSEGVRTRQAIVGEIDRLFPDCLRQVLASACISNEFRWNKLRCWSRPSQTSNTASSA